MVDGVSPQRDFTLSICVFLSAIAYFYAIAFSILSTFSINSSTFATIRACSASGGRG
jgi:hypothetical protein